MPRITSGQVLEVIDEFVEGSFQYPQRSISKVINELKDVVKYCEESIDYLTDDGF